METKYTAEIEEQLRTLYLEDPTRETVEFLALKFDKPLRSIVGKLSKMGIYQRTKYLTKAGHVPMKKSDMVTKLCGLLDVDESIMEGMEKAPKIALQKIIDALEAKNVVQE